MIAGLKHLFCIWILNLLVQQSKGFLFPAPSSADVEIQREALQNEADTNSESAQSGNFLSFKNVSDISVLVNSTADTNTATSNSGDARSGNSLFFGGGNNGTISYSEFNVISSSENNKAVSQNNTAMSGQQTAFNTIQDSLVYTNSYSGNNEATVAGLNNSADPVAAISGIETQAKYIQSQDYFGSLVVNIGEAASNNATNTLNGRAVSGIVNSIKDVDQSIVFDISYAGDNYALAANGKAIAGSQNNVGSSNSSALLLGSTANQNNATSQSGNAIAGVQNNIGSVNGTGNFFGDTNLVTYDDAVDNIAMSEDDGKAVAGVQTNVGEITEGGYVDINSRASGNRATTSGEGDTPRDSVAGVDINFNKVTNTSLNIAAEAINNQAFNYYQSINGTTGNDAIAGVEVVIGSIEGSDLSIAARSEDNFAYSKNGDAVSGNKIEVLQNKGGNNFNVYQNLYANNNTAISQNGDAIMTSQVNIQNYP